MASKCFYHPRVEAEKTCEGCRLSICDTCEQDGLCRECRNKRKAIADRKERMGGGQGATENVQTESAAPSPDASASTYDPDRVAYQSTSKVYKAMQPSSKSGVVASLTDTRVALTLGLLLGVGVLLFMGPGLLPASEPELPVSELAIVSDDPAPEAELPPQAEAEAEGAPAAESEQAPVPAPSSVPVDQAQQQIAVIWQEARRDAERQTASARAVAVAENARLAREQAQFDAMQRRQAARAEAEARQRAAQAAAQAARQSAALQASRPPLQAGRTGAARSSSSLGTGPAGSAPASLVPQAPSKMALRLLSIDGNERATLKVSAPSAPRLRYASARKMYRRRRFVTSKRVERVEGRLKPPLVTQW